MSTKNKLQKKLFKIFVPVAAVLSLGGCATNAGLKNTIHKQNEEISVLKSGQRVDLALINANKELQTTHINASQTIAQARINASMAIITTNGIDSKEMAAALKILHKADQETVKASAKAHGIDYNAIALQFNKPASPAIQPNKTINCGTASISNKQYSWGCSLNR